MSGVRTVGIRAACLAAGVLVLAACDSGAGPYTYESNRQSSVTSEIDTSATPTASQGVASPPATGDIAAPDAGGGAPIPCDTGTPAIANAIATVAPENSGVVLATSPNCAGFRWVLVSTGDTGPNAPAAALQTPRHVLLFDDDRYLGPAASVAAPYTEVIGQTADTIFVRYRWAQPGDAPDQPTGGPTVVRYQQAGGGVVALDPIPAPADTTTTTAAAGCTNQVDPSAVEAAIAVLPPTPDGPWQPGPAIVGCQELGWAVVNTPPNATSMTASHVLFFADGRYVGTATNDPIVDPVVEGNPTSNTVAVAFGPEDPNGPATVRYQWDGVRLLTLDSAVG